MFRHVRHPTMSSLERDLDMLHTNTSSKEIDEQRKKAREEAAIAKAAGFEWVNVRAVLERRQIIIDRRTLRVMSFPRIPESR